MKHLEDQDRSSFAPAYNSSDVDPEFLPYLKRINAKPFAATVQCCIGHCEYRDTGLMPRNSSGLWGYLELLMTGPSAVWLSQKVRGCDWLIAGLSKMWCDEPREMPSYTERYNFLIAFAWDGSYWPTPAEEICACSIGITMLTPEEPPELLRPTFPKDPRTKRSRSPGPRKQRRRP